MCGTKQGGILSPDFFSIYINDLVALLRNTGVGCHISKTFLACLLFSDDMALIAPTRSSLQTLLNICSEYCSTYCLTFNVKKTKVLVFGPLSKNISIIAPIYVNGLPVEIVKTWRYLGFLVSSGPSLSFLPDDDLRNFYRASNSILSGRNIQNETVQMALLYSNCIPILSYGFCVKNFLARDMRQLNTAVNNAIRRIFSYHRWESIRQLRLSLNYRSIEEIFARSKKAFQFEIKNHENSIIRMLSSID